MLPDTIDRAINDPNEEYHLSFELKRIFTNLEDGNTLNDVVFEALDESGYSEFEDCLEALSEWYQDGGFDAARGALDALEDLVDYLDTVELNQTIVVCRHRQIKIRTNLSGHDGSDELEAALDTLEEEQEEISINLVQPIMELLVENMDSLEDDLVQGYIELLENTADVSRTEGQFQLERRIINLQIQVKQSAGMDITPERDRLIESFDAHADFLDGRSQLTRASVLKTGLSRCVAFLSEDKQSEWLLESRRARKAGAETEMKRVELEEDLRDAILTEMEQNVDTIVDWFKSVRSSSSSLYALYCLLCSNGYLPDYQRAVQADRSAVVTRLFETQVTSPEGHAIARNPGIQPGEEGESLQDRIPNNYAKNVVRSTQVLSSVIYQLIDENAITADEFYILINHARISHDRKQYLTQAISNLFKGNHREAFGLAMPQLEGALVDNLEQIGRPISRLTDDGTEQRALGGLLIQVEDDLGERLCKYFEIKYTDPRGMNQRNRWAHGQSKYLEVGYLHTVTLLFDILLLLVRLDSTRYVTEYKLPMKTIETESDRRQGYDLSRYVEDGERILGYAIGEEGTIVVPVKKESEGQISLVAIRGGVRSSFDYREEEMSREEICEELEMTRRAGHADLPPANRMEWLDTEEAVAIKVQEILSEVGHLEISRERLLTETEQFGLSASRVEAALEELESEGVIELDETEIQMNHLEDEEEASTED